MGARCLVLLLVACASGCSKKSADGSSAAASAPDDDKLAAYSKVCEGLKICKQAGQCTAVAADCDPSTHPDDSSNTCCAPTSGVHCLVTSFCTEMGACSFYQHPTRGASCAVRSDADCKLSSDCKDSGECTAVSAGSHTTPCSDSVYDCTCEKI